MPGPLPNFPAAGLPAPNFFTGLPRNSSAPRLSGENFAMRPVPTFFGFSTATGASTPSSAAATAIGPNSGSAPGTCTSVLPSSTTVSSCRAAVSA
jgi:hypothetical protein